MKTTRKLIGHFGVDSGQVLIGDPCYLKDWKDNEFTDENEEDRSFSYNGACQATLSEEQAGEIQNGQAVVASTGYGDGEYPVYATYKDGRIKSLSIRFF